MLCRLLKCAVECLLKVGVRKNCETMTLDNGIKGDPQLSYMPPKAHPALGHFLTLYPKEEEGAVAGWEDRPPRSFLMYLLCVLFDKSTGTPRHLKRCLCTPTHSERISGLCLLPGYQLGLCLSSTYRWQRGRKFASTTVDCFFRFLFLAGALTCS